MAKWPVSCALIIQPVSVKLDRETDSKQESKDFQSEIKKKQTKKRSQEGQISQCKQSINTVIEKVLCTAAVILALNPYSALHTHTCISSLAL